MRKFGELFSLQLVYQHYVEFILNFDISFSIYFKEASNKDFLKELIRKYLIEFRFTEEELRLAIDIQMSRMDEELLKENSQEWLDYEMGDRKKK